MLSPKRCKFPLKLGATAGAVRRRFRVNYGDDSLSPCFLISPPSCSVQIQLSSLWLAMECHILLWRVQFVQVLQYSIYMSNRRLYNCNHRLSLVIYFPWVNSGCGHTNNLLQQFMIKEYLVPVVLSLPQTFWEILVPIFKALHWIVCSLQTLSCVMPVFVLTTTLSFLGATSTFVFGKLP